MWNFMFESCMCMPMCVHHVYVNVHVQVLMFFIYEFMDFLHKTLQNPFIKLSSRLQWWEWSGLQFYKTPTMVMQCTTTDNSNASNCALQIHNGWSNMLFKATTKPKQQHHTVTIINKHWCDQACEEQLPMHRGDVLLKKTQNLKKTRLYSNKEFLLSAL